MTKEKIETLELVEQIKIALKDVFVAKMKKQLDEIHITFLNGQKFVIAVWEDKRSNKKMEQQG